jgi:nucleotide-binding universal stress UspA family protein
MLQPDLLMMVRSVREDEPVIAAAKILQDRDDAHISALLLPKTAAQVNEWAVAADGAFWINPMREITRRAPESVRLKRRTERFSRPPCIKQIEIVDGAVADWVGVEARSKSLTVMLSPAGGEDEPFRRAMFESTLFESGRPVLLIPPKWRRPNLGQRILVAWDGSREVARAMADAEHFLQKAEQIFLFTVEGPSCESPASDAAKHLRRMGLHCQQRVERGPRSEIDAMILRECEAVDADLLVMGGYGHARLHEMLFGGVTRSLVRSAQLPLFLSR